MGKILAIDVGESRVGLATSDELGIISQGYGTIPRKNAVEVIAEIVRRENIGQIVLGMPYLPNGELGSQSKDVLNFIDELKPQVGVPLATENEVLTSVEAENRLKAIKKGNISKEEIDEMAAIIILESFLRGGKCV